MVYKQITDFRSNDTIFDSAFPNIIAEAQSKLAKVLEQMKTGQLPNLSLANEDADIAQIASISAQLRKKYKTLVVLGTGGSSLCGQTLCDFAKPKFSAENFSVIFMDNIDPETWESFLKSTDKSSTCFLTISKSGESIETLVALSACLKQFPDNISERFLVITSPSDSTLRRVATKHKMQCFEHIPNLSGRFSILSNVGLLPAACLNFNLAEYRAGAAEFLKNYSEQAVHSAAMHIALMRKNIWINVLMTYPDKLWALNTWYRQIWAESIGKNRTGSTPIRARGTLDQHSQMQLYLDGRKDKFFTLINIKKSFSGAALDNLDQEHLSYLSGKDIGDVFTAEQQATTQALLDRGVFLRNIEVAKLTERTFGMLTMHLMLETILVAEVLGLNPYDQPAVEAGKIMTRKLLGAK